MAVGCAPSLWGAADCHFPLSTNSHRSSALHNPPVHWPEGVGGGIGDGGWFVGGVGGSFVGVELGIDEADGSLVGDDVPVVSACWLHPHSVHPARAIAATT